MRLSLLCFAVACVSVFSSVTSCTLFESTCDESDRACLGSPLTAAGYGDPCKHDRDCRQGLFCIEGECKPNGTTPRGERCRLTDECMQPDYCGTCTEEDTGEYANCIPPNSSQGTAALIRVCQEAGLATLDDDCGTTGDCVHGLICEPPDLSSAGVASLGELASLSGLCNESGLGEQGAPCEDVSDCLAGLICIDKQLFCDYTMVCGDAGIEPGARICALDIELPPLPPLWEGLECPKVDVDETAKAYFHVARSGEDDPTEFFSLPFPNDALRKANGGTDLSNYPLPPPDLGLPIINRYIDAASQQPGFSTNPTIFFRFSHPYSMNNTEVQAAIKLVDVTDSTQPGFGEMPGGIEWHTTSGRVSNYICPHWLGLKPTTGSPLLPGHTYAAVITRSLRPQKGGAFAREPDFDAMLNPGTPGDAALATAHAAYAPLRDWIAQTGQSEGEILTAAVFTTQSPETLVEGLREAIHVADLPSLSEVTECVSDSTVSPCESVETVKEDGMDVQQDRGKCTTSADFRVVHARISLQIFQEGTPPYLTPNDGGALKLDINGKPTPAREEDVCIAISVPNAPMPPAGYPVLVFGHGTGGNFAGEMDASGFAGTLARAAVPAVVVGIDMPQHGSRRGESKDEPEGLFYNFLNPAAARDNVLQGAADLMSVIRWVKEGGGLSADASFPGGVLFDPAHIALMGHSQGATHSAVMVSFEPDIVGAVLSGNGGALAQSLMHKTSPFDIASIIPFGLQDPDSGGHLAGGDFNPALSAVQWVFDVADPVNYAPYLIRSPRALAPTGHHVFMTWGIGDTYSPEETQRAYVRSVGRQMPVVTPLINTLKIAPSEEEWPIVNSGLSVNAIIGGAPRTVGVRQYTPKGDTDGHFVGTSPSQDGRPDVERFLLQLLSNQTPTIGP